MKQVFSFIGNPFTRIAGMQALAWGLAGMLLSTVICYFANYHYHGLLHFGLAPNSDWYYFLLEHCVVWLIPATLFHLGGLLLSHSRIRLIDSLGTTLFALLPLIISDTIALLPPMQKLQDLALSQTPQQLAEQLQDPTMIAMIICSLLIIPVIVLLLFWLLRALQVSCNLKGWRLWATYFTGVIGGDIICRQIISYIHTL